VHAYVDTSTSANHRRAEVQVAKAQAQMPDRPQQPPAVDLDAGAAAAIVTRAMIEGYGSRRAHRACGPRAEVAIAAALPTPIAAIAVIQGHSPAS
jgi:hypothetical protein